MKKENYIPADYRFIKITNIIPLPGWRIAVEFENGESFVYRPRLDTEISAPLQDEEEFRKVRIIFHKQGIEWDNGYCLASDTIYESLIFNRKKRAS